MHSRYEILVLADGIDDEQLPNLGTLTSQAHACGYDWVMLESDASTKR